MGDPPFILTAPTALSPAAAYDCITRHVNSGNYLVLQADRDAGLVKAQSQWRGGQFGVRDFIDQFTFTVFVDDDNRTMLRVAVVTTVDNKPDEPSERGIAAAKALAGKCTQ